MPTSIGASSVGGALAQASRRRELKHGVARLFMNAVGPKGCDKVTEEGIKHALIRNYLLYDFDRLHDQFSEADFEGDGFLEENEVHAALTGRYKYRTFNDAWVELACVLLRTDSLYLPTMEDGVKKAQRRSSSALATTSRFSTPAVSTRNATWTWKAQSLRSRGTSRAATAEPPEVLLEEEAAAIVAQSMRRRESRPFTPSSQRLNWPPPSRVSTACGSRDIAVTPDEKLVERGPQSSGDLEMAERLAALHGARPTSSASESKLVVDFHAQARFQALRNVATAKSKTTQHPPPPSMPVGIEAIYQPAKPGAPSGTRVRLEGALRGGHAAPARRAANAGSFMPSRAKLPLTQVGRAILLRKAFLKDVPVPFEKNFHPLRAGTTDAMTYYLALGEPLNLKTVF